MNQYNVFINKENDGIVIMVFGEKDLEKIEDITNIVNDYLVYTGQREEFLNDFRSAKSCRVYYNLRSILLDGKLNDKNIKYNKINSFLFLEK